MTLDVKLLYFFNDFAGKSQVFDAIIIFLASYLRYFLAAGFLLLLYFSAYPPRRKFHIFWVTAISTVVARFVVTEIIRFFYHRPRPFLTYQLYPLISKNEWSFPSGHSAFFFAMATTIYLYDKKWGTWFFIAALIMSIGRIVAGAHYPSDILGGMIVGVLTAYAIFHFINNFSKWNMK